MLKIILWMAALLSISTITLSWVFGWTAELFFTILGVLGLGSALNMYWALVLRKR